MDPYCKLQSQMILNHKEKMCKGVVQAAPCVCNSKLYTHLLFKQQADNLGNVPNPSLHTD